MTQFKALCILGLICLSVLQFWDWQEYSFWALWLDEFGCDTSDGGSIKHMIPLSGYNLGVLGDLWLGRQLTSGDLLLRFLSDCAISLLCALFLLSWK